MKMTIHEAEIELRRSIERYRIEDDLSKSILTRLATRNLSLFNKIHEAKRKGLKTIKWRGK